MPRAICIALFLLISTAGSSTAQVQERTPPAVIPIPQQWSWQDGQLAVQDLRRIVLAGAPSESDRRVARQLQQALSEMHGINVEITEGAGQAGNAAILLGAPTDDLVSPHVDAGSFSDEMQEEGYVLNVVGNRVVIAGESDAGRFYGAMTLRQLLMNADEGHLRQVAITDYPAMRFRGISDDISRGQVSTMENFKKIIRFMARHKMNMYTPYIEDVLAFEAYPSVGEGRGALSKADVRELQDYAQQWHVEIMPTFQTLGHYENILNMDEFVKYAEYPGARTLNIQKPETYEFLETMLDEVTALFESDYVHIGADESWDVGKGASQEAVEEEGVIKVHADHYRRVQEMLEERGKKVMMYGDMPLRHMDPENPDPVAAFEGIPEDVIFIDWQYAATDYFPSTDMFAEAGRPFIVGPALQNWRRIYPNQSAAWTSVYNATLDGYRDGALGSIVHSWGDEGGPNFRELNYRGYAYAAETSWNPTGADQQTIDGRFNQLFYGRDTSELHAMKTLLTRLSHDVYFSDVWEHPFNTVENFPSPGNRPFPGKAIPVVASFRELPILVVANNIQESAQATLDAIDEVQDELPRNSSHLDYHAWVARLARWFGDRIEYAQWIYNTRKEFEQSERQRFAEKGVAWGQKLRCEIEELASDYRALWLRTNREANLNRLMKNFEYQQAYLADIVEALQNNEWDVPSQIPSQFVTAPNVSGEQTQSTAYLRNTFTIPENKDIERATLQLVGDTHAAVWLNGDSLGRVIARGTLSLWVKRQRVKTWNVGDQLRAGENVLAARATTYGQDVPGAANLYLEIHYADGSTERVMSDESWKATGEEPGQGWATVGYDDSSWQAAQAENRQTVSVPLFERGLSSRVE